MFGNDIFTRVKRSENKKMAEIAQFLHENDLSVDTTVEVFITVTRDESLSRAVELPEILLNALLSVNPSAVKDWR
ncbi:citrate lyase synthetase [Escherichia coli]|uniref:Citrate lyase synthetase n=1 Tax=Escherichia coli TaxID=562 RepID=A0A377F7P6_ECOLX|nr:citrate lyase synthetase [Escherichia coli]